VTGAPYENWFTPEERARFAEVRPARDARRDYEAGLIVAIEQDLLERPEVMRRMGISAVAADKIRKRIALQRGWRF
jgi:hypothetical protein